MKRRLATLLASGILLGTALLGLPSANADSGYISLAWGDNPTNLDWQPGSASHAMGSFTSDAVVVPGDRVQRTLLVRNDGPSAAIATVQFHDVGIDIPEGAANQNLPNLVYLFLSLDGNQTINPTWQQAANGVGDPAELKLRVAKGDVFAVTAGYNFPVHETGGRNAGAPSTQLSFGVMITLTEDTSTTPPDTPPPQKPGSPAQTGGEVINGWLNLLAIVIIGAGIFLALLRHDKQAT